jgi:hypothetical protein
VKKRLDISVALLQITNRIQPIFFIFWRGAVRGFPRGRLGTADLGSLWADCLTRLWRLSGSEEEGVAGEIAVTPDYPWPVYMRSGIVSHHFLMA